MAFELHCPDCKSKLRLASEPWPGTDIECPKCGSVFAAPDPRGGDASPAKKKPATGDRPRKPAPKPAEDEDEDDTPEQKPAATATEDEKKPEQKKPEQKKRKKRRIKKKESSKTVLILVCVFGAMVLGTVITVLVWFLNRKPGAYELMVYLPQDTYFVTGLNVGHLQKYPKLWEKIDEQTKGNAFHLAAQAVATAAGSKPDDMLDYVVWGQRPGGGSALVLRMKADFDPSILAKLPGAQEMKSSSGSKYYSANHYNSSTGGRVRVFAPTNRVVVFCESQIPEDLFDKMTKGNADAGEKLITTRVGPLGKRVVRGTFWCIQCFDTPGTEIKEPKASEGAGAVQQGEAIRGQTAKTASGTKGIGFKLAVGSRSVKVEVVVWQKDAETVANKYKEFKTSVLDKADEEEPKWWKDAATVMGAKKTARDLWANVSSTTSGELFIVYSRVDTVLILEDGVNGIVTLITGERAQSGVLTPGGPGGRPPGGGGGPPPGGGGGPPPGGAGGPPPGMP